MAAVTPTSADPLPESTDPSAGDAVRLFGCVCEGATGLAGLARDVEIIHVSARSGLLSPEVEEGNVEYKLHLLHPSEDRLRGLVTQMMWRLREGRGTAVYNIGVTDDGEPVGLPPKQMVRSLRTLRSMAAAAGASITQLTLRPGMHDETTQVAEAVIIRLTPTDSRGEHDGGAAAAPIEVACADAGASPVHNGAEAHAAASGSAAAAGAALPRPKSHVTVAVMGARDSGKSTWIACVTCGARDDGRGSARFRVFRHRHEVEDGRTSSVGRHVLGFAANGRVVNQSSSGLLVSAAGDRGPLAGGIAGTLGAGSHADVLTTGQSAADIVHASSQLVTLLDMAGDSKYIRTTIASVLGSAPDYAQITVPATALQPGEGGPAALGAVTKEHIVLALSLDIPVYVVITKIDRATPEMAEMVAQAVHTYIHEAWAIVHPSQRPHATDPSCEGANPPGSAASSGILIDTREAAASAAASLAVQCGSECNAPLTIPTFAISNVTGAGMPMLLAFLAALVPRHTWTGAAAEPAEFRIEDILDIDGRVVVGGLLSRGSVRVGDTLLFGPDFLGNFAPVVVASIHANRVPVPAAGPGSTISIMLTTPTHDNVARHDVRRGQVLLQPVPLLPLPPPAAVRHQSAPGVPGGTKATSAPPPGPLLSATRSEGHARAPGFAPPDTCALSPTKPVARHPGLPPRGTRIYTATVFEADLNFCVPKHCTYRINHDVVVYCACVRQPARVVGIKTIPAREAASTDTHSPLKNARVTLRFLHHPEYLVPGASVILRDGRSLAAGCVASVAEDSRSLSAPPAQRHRAADRAAATGAHLLGATPKESVPTRTRKSSKDGKPAGDMLGVPAALLPSGLTKHSSKGSPLFVARAAGREAGASTPEPPPLPPMDTGLAHMPPHRPALPRPGAGLRRRFHTLESLAPPRAPGSEGSEPRDAMAADVAGVLASKAEPKAALPSQEASDDDDDGIFGALSSVGYF